MLPTIPFWTIQNFVQWNPCGSSLLQRHRRLFCLLGRPDLPDYQVEHVNKIPEDWQDRKNDPDRCKHFLFFCIPVDEKSDEQLYYPNDHHQDWPGERVRMIHKWWHGTLSDISRYMLSLSDNGHDHFLKKYFQFQYIIFVFKQGNPWPWNRCNFSEVIIRKFLSSGWCLSCSFPGMFLL